MARQCGEAELGFFAGLVELTRGEQPLGAKAVDHVGHHQVASGLDKRGANPEAEEHRSFVVGGGPEIIPLRQGVLGRVPQGVADVLCFLAA